ncbi:MAG: S1 RNA-binding domain-containing protein, partial [Myxococcales bacterium]|nr:S1 RNA-binding domain-containing protein [Myxococcales bacterium]
HPIAWALLRHTVHAHQLGVLERTEDLSPPGQSAEHRRRDGVKAAVALWDACLAIVRKSATLSIDLATDDPERIEAFGDHVDTVTLADLPTHRWLAIRRGQKAGALALAFEVPRDELLAQVVARGQDLSAVASGRDAEALLDALVMPDIEDWALRLKDEEATLVAARNAGTAYMNLLASPRAPQALVAGIWVPKKGGQLAVAITLRDGRLIHEGKCHPGSNPVAAVEQIIGSHPVEAIILPTTAENDELLRTLASGFGELPVYRVDPKAMKAALKATEEEVAPAVGSALVLARRAVRPLKYWGQLDPIALGLAEYQQDIDEDVLRGALDEVRVLAQAGVKPEDLARATPAEAARKLRMPHKPLNPMIKTVDDLRPGMQVNGVVTNITQFGAFLNIGLAHEGLVHVSELADHFVNDPNEVVRVGQQVEARVLGVDRGRRRISLSLRSETRREGPPAPGSNDGGQKGGVRLDDIPGRGGNRRKSGFGGTGPRQPATGVSRAQALADLEALFKK